MRACYRFTLKVGRVPPRPVVGCAFDESVPSVGPCYYPYYPLKKMLSTRVELVRVTPSS